MIWLGMTLDQSTRVFLQVMGAVRCANGGRNTVQFETGSTVSSGTRRPNVPAVESTYVLHVGHIVTSFILLR